MPENKKPKMVVVGDALLPPDVIAEGMRPLAEAGWEVATAWFGPPGLDALDEILMVFETAGPDPVPVPETLGPLLEGADVLVVHMCPVPAALLRRHGQLLAVGVLRGGFDNVDAAGAADLGIPVVRTLGRTAEAVSDFTVGLMLAEMRNIARAHARIAQGQWPKGFPNSGRAPEMRELVVGIVGFGEIGRMVARKLSGFRCRVWAADPFVPPQEMEEAGVKAVSLEELLTAADVVTLHARHQAGQPPLIGREQLALMKPTAYLVNTARASLVDMEALAECLREGRLMGAAIDVWDQEPPPPDHPLLRLENVTLTSHIAYDTEAFLKRSAFLWRQGMGQVLSGRDLRAWVNPSEAGRRRLARLAGLWGAGSSL